MARRRPPARPDESLTAPIPARPALPRIEPIVRVRVLTSRDAATPMRIGTEARWIEMRRLGEGDAADTGAVTPTVVVLRSPVQIRMTARGWSVLDANRFRPSVAALETLEFSSIGKPIGAAITIQDQPYPGFARLVARSDAAPGAYDVINHVSMEHYLPGVLAKELYAHWHLQTHAAQAIAARSFACSELTYFADRRHFDVTNTALSQAYIGLNSHPRAVDAVDMTRGVVLAYDGYLVPGYYSSCCGGTAAVARDAIGEHPYNDVPPLRGRDGADVCTEAPLYSWSIQRSRRDLARRVAAYGKARNIKTLARCRTVEAIEVAEINPHGRPRRYAVTTNRNKSVELDAEDLRRAIDCNDGPMPAPEQPLWSAHLAASFSRRSVRFDGRGHGHGVGLCQYGTETLAQRGETCSAILRWYYPDVEITSAYG